MQKEACYPLRCTLNPGWASRLYLRPLASNTQRDVNIALICNRIGIPVADARILVMGLAFKENCPDVRNTHVVDIVSDLASYSAQVDVFDPCVNPEEARHEYGISPIAEPKPANYDAIVIAVGHRQFADMGSSKIHSLGTPSHVLYDIKYLLPAQESDARI